MHKQNVEIVLVRVSYIRDKFPYWRVITTLDLQVDVFWSLQLLHVSTQLQLVTGWFFWSVRKFFQNLSINFWSKLAFKAGNRFYSASACDCTLEIRKWSSGAPPTKNIEKSRQNWKFQIWARNLELWSQIIVGICLLIIDLLCLLRTCIVPRRHNQDLCISTHHW